MRFLTCHDEQTTLKIIYEHRIKRQTHRDHFSFACQYVCPSVCPSVMHWSAETGDSAYICTLEQPCFSKTFFAHFKTKFNVLIMYTVKKYHLMNVI